MTVTRFLTTLLLGAAVAAPAAATQYTITDLGTLSGNGSSEAYGLNDAGVVVGYSQTSAGDVNGFAWYNGFMVDTGPAGLQSVNLAINNSNNIAGYSHPFSVYDYSAYLQTQCCTINLPTLGGVSSLPYAINDYNDIVGRSSYSPTADLAEAFLYSGGRMIGLGTLGGTYSEALGINNSDQIVGDASLSDGSDHAFIDFGGVMRDLGTLAGGGTSIAFAINAAGVVTGGSSVSSSSDHAFVWTAAGGMVDLGTLGGANSEGEAINAAGEVVGTSLTSTNDLHAFIYDQGAMTDLNTEIDPGSGWSLTEARGINASGQIVGRGQINNERHAFILNPIATVPPSAVPEPATWAMMLVGFGLAGSAIRRRRLAEAAA